MGCLRASCPSHWGQSSGTDWTGGWMGPRTGQDALEKWKIPFLHWELNCSYSDVQPTTWSLLTSVSWHTSVTLNKMSLKLRIMSNRSTKCCAFYMCMTYQQVQVYSVKRQVTLRLIMKSGSIGSLITTGCCCY